MATERGEVIHYENYSRFSRGQGYVGALCRTVSPQAKSMRWVAVDCGACREKIVGQRVISSTIEGEQGEIEKVLSTGVFVRIFDSSFPARVVVVNWRDFDFEWGPE